MCIDADVEDNKERDEYIELNRIKSLKSYQSLCDSIRSLQDLQQSRPFTSLERR